MRFTIHTVILLIAGTVFLLNMLFSVTGALYFKLILLEHFTDNPSLRSPLADLVFGAIGVATLVLYHKLVVYKIFLKAYIKNGGNDERTY